MPPSEREPIGMIFIAVAGIVGTLLGLAVGVGLVGGILYLILR